MVLGCYYLTVNNVKGLCGSNHYFANLEDVILAYEQNEIEIHSLIWVRYNNENQFTSNLIKKVELNDNTFIEYYENLQIRKSKNGNIIVQYLRTTTVRAILNYTIQKILIVMLKIIHICSTEIIQPTYYFVPNLFNFWLCFHL